MYEVSTLISLAATAVVSPSAAAPVMDRQIPVPNRIPCDPNGIVTTAPGGTGMVSATAVVPTVTLAELYSFTYRAASARLVRSSGVSVL